MILPSEHDTLHWIRTEFNLPKNIASLCENYFIRIWSGPYIVESVQNGFLYGRSDNWEVHFQSTPEVVATAKTVACSFREYNGKKYVVVKVWEKKEQQGKEQS